MTPPGWLTSSLADVPADDAWLSPRERAVLARLRIAKRRDDWRLGRWAAKAAVAAWLGVPAARIEILAADDGAPEAFLDGDPAPVSISLSHREGCALAVVADAPAVVGCDLELIEPRSGAFVREWLSDGEDASLEPLTANLLWTAKEAAAKVRREGLRLDVRRARVDVAGAGGGWRPLTVVWAEGITTAGWWRDAAGWVMTIAGAPAPARPRRLGAGS